MIVQPKPGLKFMHKLAELGECTVVTVDKAMTMYKTSAPGAHQWMSVYTYQFTNVVAKVVEDDADQDKQPVVPRTDQPRKPRRSRVVQGKRPANQDDTTASV